MKTESGAEAQKFDPAASAGLFVGVTHFDEPLIDPVPFAVDDAVDLAYLFTIELGLAVPERIVLLLAGEPQKSTSQERLASLRSLGARLGRPRFSEVFRELESLTQATGPRGLFVMAAASHGIAEQGNSYFVAEDTRLARPFRTSVAVSEVFEDASQVDSKRALVLLDACRERLTKEGSRGLGGKALNEEFSKAIAAAEGVAVLSGTILGGYSFDDPERENGVFTAAVLDGLRGDAPPGEEGWITVHSLAPFVESRVVAWVKKNRPEFAGKSRGVGLNLDVVKSFPLAPHPQASRELEEYREKKAAGLAKVKSAQGAIIKGGHWDLAEEILANERPNPEALELLDVIDSIDASPKTQRMFVGYVELQRKKAPAISTPHVEVVSPTPPSRVVTPREPKAGDIHEGPFGLRFCWIPSGKYTLGSPKNEPGRYDDEQEPHEIVLPAGFWLGETPLTQRQWNELVAEKPFHFQHCGPDCPAENINWFEALTFANLLSEREGLPPCYELLGRKGKLGEDLTYEKVAFLGGEGYRLPSEDEWEIAARAGTTTALYTGGITIQGERHAPELDAIAWYGGNSGVTYKGGADSSGWKEMQVPAKLSGPHPVKQKKANGWGLFDMLGNVAEWCDEAVDPYPSLAKNPEGQNRVIRGGSWYSSARDVRAAYRDFGPPSRRNEFLGFRLARGQGLLSSQGARSAQK